MRTKLINKCNHLDELTVDERIIQSLPNEKQKWNLRRVKKWKEYKFKDNDRDNEKNKSKEMW